MKILVVSNMYPSKSAPSYGVFVKNFCRGLTETGIDYDLAVMRKQNGKAKKLLGYITFLAGSFFKSLFGRYDVVYIHYASHSSAGVLLARRLRKFRIFTNLHGSDAVPENPSHEKMQRFTRKALAYSEKVIVPSPYFKKLVAQKYGIDEDVVHVCASGGVNPEIFHPVDVEKSPVFTMGSVGRISAGKGWQTMLHACALLKTPYRLIIVGDGPEAAQMEALIDKLQLREFITRYPLLPQEKLPEIYSSIDVFLFPTERAGESLGLVGLEAMACGTPVISSDFAAPADYVRDGVNGFQFPKGDAAGLADAINRCMQADLDALGKNAVQTAAGYNASQVTQTMKSILLG